MISKLTITPKFNVHQWARKRLGTVWTGFQARAVNLGQNSHAYMINYIKSHKKRGQSPHLDGTLPLEKSIRFYLLTATPTMVAWGIGRLRDVQTQSPHWYVINYGVTVTGARFIPNRGQPVPGYFSPSGRPNATARNGSEPFIYDTGTFVMRPQRPIRPINYIQATQFKLGNEFRRLLPKSIMPGQLRATRGMGGAMGGGVWRT